MEITIGHLYPKELCLYGENGNIKALKHALENKNVKVNTININEDDKIDFNNFDFLYIGSGTTSNLELVKKRLSAYKDELLRYINNNKIILITGNAISIFDFLDLFETELVSTRVVEDVVATTSLCNGKIKGFQNTEYLIKSTNKILFNLESGVGNNETPFEGFTTNNLYATSIIGPILARNDALTNYFIEILLKD